MTRNEVYDSLRAWLHSHGFDVGYRIQKRFWKDSDESAADRFIVIQQNGGGRQEEAISRDYFRILLLSGQNDSNINEVEDHAHAIRQAMIDDYKTECIISMQPIGGITAIQTEEGRYLFDISFQTIISR
ncbi:phage tail termination protein [Enterobacter bugandensis]|uniref:phage tail termination protein n=1 Tax=Enterobacter bugandensis TaxID=881260 RepID=UPI003BBDCAC1